MKFVTHYKINLPEASTICMAAGVPRISAMYKYIPG